MRTTSIGAAFLVRGFVVLIYVGSRLSFATPDQLFAAQGQQAQPRLHVGSGARGTVGGQRHLQQPRMKVLGERDWGAWHDARVNEGIPLDLEDADRDIGTWSSAL